MSEDKVDQAVPEGWKIVKLGDRANIFRGGSPRPIQAYLTTLSTGINWIKIGDVEPEAKYINATNEKIIPEGASHSREVKKGDFVLSNSMSFGRPYILNINGCIHDGWLVIQDYQNNFDQHYLYYALCSDFTMIQYKGMAAGSSVQNLSKEKVADVVLLKPPLPEQHAIAETLSGMDEYIASLEKLIAKKKAIKQGAMQELLTGKRRLPGFDGEWVNFYLSKNSIIKARIGWQGLTTAEYSNEGYAFLVTGTDFMDGRIDWNSCYYVDKLRYDQDVNNQIINNDILITKDGTVGKVAMVNGLKKNGTLNSGIFVIRPINFTYDNLFVYYILSSQIFAKFLAKLSAGSTINHLYQKEFVDFSFLLPPVIEEQKAVAGILLDMDAEIETLTAKLDKAKSIKQGMMRELLTGRIRLVNLFEKETPNG